jgi:hypothetical protein
MSYYLHHYFDPDFDHLAVKPRVNADGQADLHNLGYVQNVVKGQILAEFVPAGQEPEQMLRAEFLQAEPVFPAGPNTRVDPACPQYLLADANGYAFIWTAGLRSKTSSTSAGMWIFTPATCFSSAIWPCTGTCRPASACRPTTF